MVDGVVREVFTSARRDRVDWIVQIEVKRSEAVRSPRMVSRVPMPAPGDVVYVHTSQPGNRTLGLQGSGGARPPDRDAAALAVPAERAQVRAFLGPRTSGGWEGVGAPWFDLTSREPAESTPADPPPSATERRAGPPG